MELIVDRNELIRALTKVQTVVEKRNPVAILSNIKIEAYGSSLKLTATDMDMCAMDVISAQVISEGASTVPSQWYEIIRKLPEGEVKLSITSVNSAEQIAIAASSSNFTLPCLPVQEFPNFEVSASYCTFNIHSELLKALITKTRHALALDETRYYLAGIYIHPAESDNSTVFRAVATDGHRLARADCPLPEGAENMEGIIIPRKAVHELVKLLDSYLGNVEVSVAHNRATFAMGNTVFITRLVDGKFPDYSRVIPANNNVYLEVNTKDFVKAIDLVTSVLIADKTKTVVLQPATSELTLTANGEMNGSASGIQKISANYDANPVTLSFNARYILDPLSVIEGDTVRLMLPANNDGAILAQDTSDQNSLYLLMPMQE